MALNNSQSTGWRAQTSARARARTWREMVFKGLRFQMFAFPPQTQISRQKRTDDAEGQESSRAGGVGGEPGLSSRWTSEDASVQELTSRRERGTEQEGRDTRPGRGDVHVRRARG